MGKPIIGLTEKIKGLDVWHLWNVKYHQGFWHHFSGVESLVLERESPSRLNYRVAHTIEIPPWPVQRFDLSGVIEILNAGEDPGRGWLFEARVLPSDGSGTVRFRIRLKQEEPDVVKIGFFLTEFKFPPEKVPEAVRQSVFLLLRKNFREFVDKIRRERDWVKRLASSVVS